MGSKDRVWEVFRQEAEGDPMVHGGSVKAPDEGNLAPRNVHQMVGMQVSVSRLLVNRHTDVRLAVPFQ